MGAFNLLECFKEYSKKYKSKLVHISTDEVYGDILSGRTSGMGAGNNLGIKNIKTDFAFSVFIS